MDVSNAIARVRFATVKPQRVHLNRTDHSDEELICMEAGQSIHADQDTWSYYVIMGSAVASAGKQSEPLSPGSFLAMKKDEAHTITNTNDSRLVLLAIKKS